MVTLYSPGLFFSHVESRMDMSCVNGMALLTLLVDFFPTLSTVVVWEGRMLAVDFIAEKVQEHRFYSQKSPRENIGRKCIILSLCQKSKMANLTTSS